MKSILQYSGIFFLITGLMIGCGPSEEEQQQAEQARQDSLEQVRQDSLQQIEQQRQDSLEAARADSIKQAQEESTQFSFTEDGAFSVQVASWRSEWKASEEVQMWKDRGFEDAYYVQHGAQETGNVWYRVRVGRVDSRDEAQRIQQHIQDEYQSPSWIAAAN